MSLTILKSLLPLLTLLPCATPGRGQTATLTWQAVPHDTTPPDTAYAKGVSASYAALAGQTLLMAGGCNFPHTPAAEGGKKVYYDGIYALSAARPAAPRRVGSLPEAAAYGVSLPAGEDGMLCIGGQSASGPLHSVLLLQLCEGGEKVTVRNLPPLPAPIDNMGGALLGRRVYIVGGNVGGKPSNAMYSLHLDSLAAGWREEPSYLGPPRVQPVVVALRCGGETCLYVFGGFSSPTGQQPVVSTTSLRYSPSRHSWTEAAAPTDEAGHPLTLTGGAGYAIDDTTALCLGGVNHNIFLAAIQRERRLAEATARGDEAEAGRLREAGRAYLRQPAEAYRFNELALRYSSASDRWTILGRHPQAARAGATMAGCGNAFFYIGGELKPGIRTPEIWHVKGKVSAKPKSGE